MKSNSKTYIIILLLLFSENEGNVFQYGKYFNYNSSILKLYHHGPQTCAKECVYLPECKSFNWRDFECTIYADDENTAGVKTMTSSDSVYGERNDAIKVVSDGCKQNTCPEDHKCVPLRNSGKTCVKTVCAHAPPNFNFTNNNWNGKRSDVGTVIDYTCYNGYQLISESSNITCRKDGTWDNREIFCQKIATCPSDYQYKSSIKFCYKLFGDWSSWPDAKQKCEQNGGYMVSLDTDDKFNILKDYLTAIHPNTRALTSARWNGTAWNWGNGISFDVTKHVNPTIPIILGEDCLYQQGSYWYSMNCSLGEGIVFVCENIL